MYGCGCQSKGDIHKALTEQRKRSTTGHKEYETQTHLAGTCFAAFVFSFFFLSISQFKLNALKLAYITWLYMVWKKKKLEKEKKNAVWKKIFEMRKSDEMR